MKRIILVLFILGVIGVGSLSYAEDADMDQVVARVSSDLEGAGFTTTEIINVQKPASRMIAAGAFESEVVKALKLLRDAGLTGRVLSDCVHILTAKVEGGENVTTSSEALVNIVKDGRDRGLKGKNLVNYIHRSLI